MNTKELAKIIFETGYAKSLKEAKAIVQFVKDNSK